MLLISSRNVNPVNAIVVGRIQDPDDKNPAIPCLDVNWSWKTLLTSSFKTCVTDKNILFASFIRRWRLEMWEVDNFLSSAELIPSNSCLIRCKTRKQYYHYKIRQFQIYFIPISKFNLTLSDWSIDNFLPEYWLL
jgi:hypothetical protein